MFSGKGLSSAEAKEKLEKHGRNELPEKPPPSDIRILLSQLKSPLVYILLFAGVVTFFLNHHSDTIIIALAVFINTILGFIQERKANKALYALKKLIQPKATVIRDGERKEIPVEEVVPGDVCVLDEGEKIPADGELVDANRLFVAEAVLTGESVPVSKDEREKAFMGTIVTAGKGVMKVKVTGKDTEIGKIALSIQEEQEATPLKRQITHFSKQLTILVTILTVFVFLIGLIQGAEKVEIFTTSVALAVSAIPEGLLVGMTVVLAIGMQRILSRKGLVRNLVSAETLGGVTTICVDKTGTLTKGKMQVVEVVGDEVEIAKQGVIANDMDDPVVVAIWEWAGKKLTNKDLKGESIHGYVKKHPRIDSIPFSSKERFFASLNKVRENTHALFVNGAPEFLLEWSNLNENEKQDVKGEIDRLTSEGKRLVGLARKEVPNDLSKLTSNMVKEELEWVGIVALSDPVRQGVKDALEKTDKAGIKTLVITGDYAQTAVFVLKSLEIQVDEDSIMLGSELRKTNEETLVSKLQGEDRVKLFARTTPQQKLKIVNALKKNGEVVAMMGDGVNDAPALQKADIGIVVGEATDVAKESADLVLLDSNFSTIVAAIEEGRGIYDNLRKIILYLMSDAFSEIVAVVGTVLLRLPLPVTAAQILWINLVSDGSPHLALTVDPKRPGIMNRPPRPPSESIVTPWMKWLIAIVSLFSGLSALALFIYIINTTGDAQLGRSAAFLLLGINSLVYVFSIRTLRQPFWKESPFDNKWLLVAVLVGTVLQLVPFLTETGRDFFKISIMPVSYWVAVLVISLIMFIMIEVTKVLFKERLTKL